jgi:hypothetical protein
MSANDFKLTLREDRPLLPEEAAKLRTERDALLAACEDCAGFLETLRNTRENEEGAVDALVAEARAAISLARGGR